MKGKSLILALAYSIATASTAVSGDIPFAEKVRQRIKLAHISSARNLWFESSPEDTSLNFQIKENIAPDPGYAPMIKRWFNPGTYNSEKHDNPKLEKILDKYFHYRYNVNIFDKFQIKVQVVDEYSWELTKSKYNIRWGEKASAILLFCPGPGHSRGHRG